MLKSSRYHQSGFSLIEAMLAFLVVGIGLLGLAKLQSGFFKSNGSSRVYTAALNYAQQKIEQLRSFASESDYTSRFSELLDSPESCDPLTKDSLCQGINAGLERTWSIADCPDDLPCRRVEVNVVWTDADGIKQTVALSSFIAAYEPVQSGVALTQ